MTDIISYSSKATALRGIARMGLTDKVEAAKLVHADNDGKFHVSKASIDQALGLTGLSEVDENNKLACGHHECPHCGINLDNGWTDFDGMVDCHGSEAAAFKLMKHEFMCLGCNGEWGKEIVIKSKSTGKGGTMPTRHYDNKSTVQGAVAASHALYDANPELRRKDAIALAVENGITFYTARTQYQKWFKARAAK